MAGWARSISIDDTALCSLCDEVTRRLGATLFLHPGHFASRMVNAKHHERKILLFLCAMAKLVQRHDHRLFCLIDPRARTFQCKLSRQSHRARINAAVATSI